MENATVTLYLNNNPVGSFVSQSIIFANRNVDFHIGSTFGEIYNLEGFVYRFDYWLNPRADFSEYYSELCEDSCDHCPLETGCLSNCALNEFINTTTGVCELCHVSCSNGCVDNNECDECHPSCKTCDGDGKEEDECTSCFCGAHLSLPGLAKSPCECDVQFNGDATACDRICPDLNCHKCRTYQDAFVCIECNEGFYIGEDGLC